MNEDTHKINQNKMCFTGRSRYSKGYSIYPGDNFIEVYENMAARIADEIKRKRKKPAAIYFCPSCDPFQPLPEIQQLTREVMKIILENDIGVQFVTKGNISEEIFDLFKKHSSKIAGQIGLISVDERERIISFAL